MNHKFQQNQRVQFDNGTIKGLGIIERIVTETPALGPTYVIRVIGGDIPVQSYPDNTFVTSESFLSPIEEED